jgi:hypothetical protein
MWIQIIVNYIFGFLDFLFWAIFAFIPIEYSLLFSKSELSFPPDSLRVHSQARSKNFIQNFLTTIQSLSQVFWYFGIIEDSSTSSRFQRFVIIDLAYRV